MPITQSALGTAFAEALAKKDFDSVAALIHPEISFRGLTPGKNWEAHSPEELVDNVLTQWFEPSDEIDELVSVDSGMIADRERVGYRFRGHNPDGPFVVEQQAYLEERDGKIGWMRVLCSGFRPPVS
jgi:SnoaL-like domain